MSEAWDIYYIKLMRGYHAKIEGETLVTNHIFLYVCFLRNILKR